MMRTSPWLGRTVSGIALLTICALDWLVTPGALTQFYSVPVALSALGDSWRGGLIASILSSIAILLTPDDTDVFHRLASSVALMCLGLVVGFVFDREHRQKSSLRTTAEQLSSVHERVQANFEGMKRIERLSAIGQLSAGLAHEIRNPLASIAGAASILSKNKTLEPKHVKCIDIITTECDGLNGLLTNFLDFARPRPPHLQTTHVDAVLDNVLALASHGIRGKVVHCEKTTQADLPPVECDPEQLEQVLLNLMINAIEASPDEETVTLSAGTEEGTVAVRVIDQGHGVAPANIDRLFDPFFTTKDHGTGLGLPVAHQIMTQMGGTLRAERNSGKGMTFSIVLPTKRRGL
jgi:two-component system, NtrC family, sensor histidine kinase HydH